MNAPSHDFQPVFRFAPSPNGQLHLGHALSALITWEAASLLDGRFLLRIEDIDISRTRETYVEGIKRDLAFLGLTWETPVLRQSARFDAYQEALAKLHELNLLYPCFATRSQIAAAGDPAMRDPDGAQLYPGLHKELSDREIMARKAAGQPFALRLDMDRAMKLAMELASKAGLVFHELQPDGRYFAIKARPELWGDVIIARKDVPTSYHLAVVVDDAHQQISHVTRGKDLLPATDIHCLLQRLLGLPTPIYQHHRLVTNHGGRKLSKSLGDASLSGLRKAGASIQDIRAMIAVTHDDLSGFERRSA